MGVRKRSNRDKVRQVPARWFFLLNMDTCGGIMAKLTSITYRLAASGATVSRPGPTNSAGFIIIIGAFATPAVMCFSYGFFAEVNTKEGFMVVLG